MQICLKYCKLIWSASGFLWLFLYLGAVLYIAWQCVLKHLTKESSHYGCLLSDHRGPLVCFVIGSYRDSTVLKYKRFISDEIINYFIHLLLKEKFNVSRNLLIFSIQSMNCLILPLLSANRQRHKVNKWNNPDDFLEGLEL